ncbi:hypothetical protein L3X38_030506 [Prunus dulcis]|uniref:Uncharacterized protein n=1 Tax=Prunus dulcis TaxID=3755 RepID=A0AAD4VAD5_PRUDU|nr:hypothetical protein L3X38_030506 [Prunus dulcis]
MVVCSVLGKTLPSFGIERNIGRLSRNFDDQKHLQHPRLGLFRFVDDLRLRRNKTVVADTSSSLSLSQRKRSHLNLKETEDAICFKIMIFFQPISISIAKV